ncbi:MAG: sulfatase-like hydrolase/transferase [Draconibacterium sp.]
MRKAFLCLFVLGLFGVSFVAPKEESVPNLILILVDDMGYADVGFNGCTDIPTPNIDKLAESGVRFTNGYVSYCVCGPSRAGLLTGRYQERYGFGRNPLFTPNDPEMGLPLSEETLADALKQAGYKSVAIGKWHLGAHESLHPLKRGFDDFYGFLSGGHRYFPEELTLENEFEAKSQGDGYRTKLLRNHERVEETEYLTDAFSREAVSYIEQNLNLDENTIVVFLSDNGGPEKTNGSNNGILRGQKSDLFEGGIRVPFAIKWPAKIPAGMVYDNPVISMDIFSTIIEQTGNPIQLKNTLDGTNLIPYLTGENKSLPHDQLFWRKFDARDYAIRQGNEKLYIKGGSEKMLFNLSADISEENNIEGTNKERFQQLYNEFTNWEQQLEDPVFMGLMQNKEYSDLHPDRFERKVK